MNLQPISTNEISLKIILLGDSTVGKSSLLSRLLNENPPEYYNATIGLDFKVMHIPSLFGNVKLQLWDVGAHGQRFREILTTYYRNCDAAIFVFDLTNRQSFNNLTKWYESFEEQHKEKDFCRMLIGNKSDLANERQVTEEEMRDFAEKRGMNRREISAMINTNAEVLEFIMNMVDEILILRKRNLEAEEMVQLKETTKKESKCF